MVLEIINMSLVTGNHRIASYLTIFTKNTLTTNAPLKFTSASSFLTLLNSLKQKSILYL